MKSFQLACRYVTIPRLSEAPVHWNVFSDCEFRKASLFLVDYLSLSIYDHSNQHIMA